MTHPRRIAALATVLALALAGWSCQVDAPSGPSPGAPEFKLIDQPVGGLLSCAPLPAASASALIGPAGGVLAVGPHRLAVPAGALDAAIVITASVETGWANSVELAPEGLTFAEGRPARLTLGYANCWLPGPLPRRVAYTTSSLKIQNLLPSADNPAAREVSAPLQHFSRYAVAW